MFPGTDTTPVTTDGHTAADGEGEADADGVDEADGVAAGVGAIETEDDEETTGVGSPDADDAGAAASSVGVVFRSSARDSMVGSADAVGSVTSAAGVAVSEAGVVGLSDSRPSPSSALDAVGDADADAEADAETDGDAVRAGVSSSPTPSVQISGKASTRRTADTAGPSEDSSDADDAAA